MTITESNFLDVFRILMEEVVGSVWLGYFIMLAIIIFWGIRSRVPYQSLLAICVIASFMFMSIVYNQLLLLLIIFVVGILFYSIQKGIFKR